MVAVDAEADLYRRLFRECGVTPLMLTQRMFLPDLFSKELSLGHRSMDGWILEERAAECATHQA